MNEGSWLIKFLVENIEQFAKEEDLLTILTKTFSDINKKTLEHNKKFIHKKVPCLISTLIKRLYFTVDREININNNEDSLNTVELEINDNEKNDLNHLVLQSNESHQMITETDNVDSRIVETEEETSSDAIVAEEEIARRCSLITLLLPTIFMFLLICSVLYMFVYEEEFTNNLLEEWDEIIRSLFTKN